MYPHQHDAHYDSPLFCHDQHIDHTVYAQYPAVVDASEFHPAPRSAGYGNYGPPHHSYTAYPQPCVKEYPPYPPQLHIQAELHAECHDAQSPYASASVSPSTAYHTPTSPSDNHSARSEQQEYGYDMQEYGYDMQDTDPVPSHQHPHRVLQPDALSHSLWQQSDPADSTEQSYGQTDTEHVDFGVTSSRRVRKPSFTTSSYLTYACPAHSQWSPAHGDADPAANYPLSALSCYPDAQAHLDGEQLSSSNVPYPEQQPYPHAPQYGGAAMHRDAYGRDPHDGAMPSQVEHEGPMVPSHGSDAYDALHVHPEQGSAHMVVEQSAYPPHATAVHDGVFDSPLRDHTQGHESGSGNEYPVPPVPTAGQIYAYDQLPDPGFQRQQQHRSPVAYSQAGTVSWHPPSPSDYYSVYPESAVDEQSPPQSIVSLHSSLQASPAYRSQHPNPVVQPSCDPPGPQNPQNIAAQPQFQATTQSPACEDHFSAVCSPAREAVRPPMQTSRLLEWEPIPRLSQPRRTSVSASSRASGSGSSSPLRSPRREKRTPSRAHGAEQDEPLPQAPVVPSQSHLVPRHDPPTQSFRPFHPYPSHQRAEYTPRIHDPDGLGGGCTSPTSMFGLFRSSPLLRGPREQPLPGPTCSPASSSSVMRLVLTPPFKRPPPPPPPAAPPPPTRHPRMACYFCRKRKIACKPGRGVAQVSQGGKDCSSADDNGPCNQCARRGLDCERPTESKRGVRKSKSRVKEGEDDGEGHRHPIPNGLGVTLELAPRPRAAEETAISEDEDDDDDDQLEVPDPPLPPGQSE